MNKLALYVGKTKSVLFGTSTMLVRSPGLSFQDDSDVVEQVDDFKYFGITLETGLTFETHVRAMARRISTRPDVHGIVRKNSLLKRLIVLYNSLILPHFHYASTIWSNTYENYTN